MFGVAPFENGEPEKSLAAYRKVFELTSNSQLAPKNSSDIILTPPIYTLAMCMHKKVRLLKRYRHTTGR